MVIMYVGYAHMHLCSMLAQVYNVYVALLTNVCGYIYGYVVNAHNTHDACINEYACMNSFVYCLDTFQ